MRKSHILSTDIFEKVELGMSQAPEQASSQRRQPNQQRSRERVERILGCATTLIERDGSDSLRMSELAQLAEISIGSLYQYFPDKASIIRTLAERHSKAGQDCIQQAMESVTTPKQLLTGFADLIDLYYGYFLAEPVMRDVWSGTQADPALREIELADCRANASHLVEALMRFLPNANPAHIASRAFLVFQLGESAMRLAVSVDRAEGDVMVEAYKRMATAELKAILKG